MEPMEHSTTARTKPAGNFARVLAAVGWPRDWLPSQPRFCWLQREDEPSSPHLRKRVLKQGTYRLRLAILLMDEFLADLQDVPLRSAESPADFSHQWIFSGLSADV